MSDSLAITLHASGEVVESGSGTAVDLWDEDDGDGVETRRLAVLVLALTAISGTAPALVVFLDTSSDGSSWTEVDSFASQGAAAVVELKTGDFERYVRCRWTIAGGGAATFSVTGVAHEAWCTLAQLATLGAMKAAVATITKTDRVDHLIATTQTARGYVRRRHQTPIIRVGTDVAQAVAKMASLSLVVDVKGVNPNPEATALALDEARAKERWLRDVSNGIAGADVVDSTPETSEGSGAVATETSRGWGSMNVV